MNVKTQQLVDQIARIPFERLLRRRAVLCRNGQEWSILCCVVEALTSKQAPMPRTTQSYDAAVLYEDLLTRDQACEFIAQISSKEATFGKYKIALEAVNWARVDNWTTYMSRSGVVFSASAGRNYSGATHERLIRPHAPYYPDSYEAARHWLEFPVYHGSSDARNGEIVFLIPESRAFILDCAFKDNDTLMVEFAGTDVMNSRLLIKGAFWNGAKIHHVEAIVDASKISLPVSRHASRLELILINEHGEIYDSQSHHQYSSLGNESLLGGQGESLLGLIRQAAREGEGVRSEFKPFIRLNNKKKSETPASSDDNNKKKLLEVIRTVVAFANNDGGTIFLGISDECSIEGVNAHAVDWAQAALSTAIDKYQGVLMQSIRDVIRGHVDIAISACDVDGAYVIVVQVSPANEKPICIDKDFALYVRTGATNRRVMPDEWSAALGLGAMKTKSFLQ